METSFGSYLRQLRLSRHLSQTQAAQLAGIGRVTLNRWETGAQHPRLLDLESLLGAMSTTQQERRQALTILGTPFDSLRSGSPSPVVIQSGKKVIEPPAVPASIGAVPHRGELLRALRMRRGFSQEETALKMGVTTRTVRRWESSEVWPSPSTISSLCYYLEARHEEMLALTSGYLPLLPEIETASLSDLRAHGHRIFFYTDDTHTQPLKELSFVLLEIQLWRFASSSEAGRQILSEIYSYHAQYLCRLERFAESGYYADRALELWPKNTSPNTKAVMAGITAARSAAFKGVRPTPRRGIEILEFWSEAAHWPEYRAWILSEMAEFKARTGDLENGLALAKRATIVAMSSDNPHELHNRELDEARLLIETEQPREALKVILRDREDPYLDHPAKFRLLETTAYLRLGETSIAQDRFQDALRLIEEKSLAHLLPIAQKLALEF